MIYPYFLYDRKIKLHPIFTHLKGSPYIADLSSASTLLKGIDVRDQRAFQEILEGEMAEKHSWGVSAYLERRDSLLSDCPQMVAEERFIHLGLDVIVPLGKTLHAPLDAVVQESGYEAGEGNYGTYVLLRHESPLYHTFYSFYGHLCTPPPVSGKHFPAGSPFAAIGDFHENGNWFHHTHIQILTQKGYDRSYISKGYCSDADMAEMNFLCPSPIPLFSPG